MHLFIIFRARAVSSNNIENIVFPKAIKICFSWCYAQNTFMLACVSGEIFMYMVFARYCYCHWRCFNKWKFNKIIILKTWCNFAHTTQLRNHHMCLRAEFSFHLSASWKFENSLVRSNNKRLMLVAFRSPAAATVMMNEKSSEREKKICSEWEQLFSTSGKNLHKK